MFGVQDITVLASLCLTLKGRTIGREGNCDKLVPSPVESFSSNLTSLHQGNHVIKILRNVKKVVLQVFVSSRGLDCVYV